MTERAISIAGGPAPDLGDTGNQFTFGGFILNVNGLVVPKDMPFQEWEKLGDRLAVMERGIQFVIGDWLNMLEDRFGEEAAQAIDATRWSEKTLSACRWVAKSVPPESRMMDRGLSFEHHKAVAKLSPSKQRTWLKKAAGDGTEQPWTVARLRAAMTAGEDLPIVGWRLLVTCDSPEDRQQLQDRLEGQGKACKPVDKRERRKKEAAA